MKKHLIILILALPIFLWGQSITQAEYFIDSDPGIGNGVGLSLVAGNPVMQLDSADVAGLSTGFHRISIRFKDNNNRWTHAKSRQFYIEATVAPPNPLQDVVAGEYFVDTDPGIGNAVALNIPTSGTNVNVLDSIDVSALAVGFHRASVRFQDADGLWSHAKSRSFYIEEEVIPVPQEIIAAEYFFNDNDPGWNNAIPLAINNPADMISWMDSLDMGALTMCDTNTVSLRVKSNNGLWSKVAENSFQIYSYSQCACVIDELMITGNHVRSEIYHVNQKIDSDGQVRTDSVVVFWAGDEINLTAGFEVDLGADFLGDIEACASMLIAEPSSISTSIQLTKEKQLLIVDTEKSGHDFQLILQDSNRSVVFEKTVQANQSVDLSEYFSKGGTYFFQVTSDQVDFEKEINLE